MTLSPRSGPVRLPPSAGEALEPVLATDPGRAALVAADGRLTYEALDELVERAAGGLYERGVRRGDVVAVSVANTTAVVISFYAVLRLGAIWLGVNRNLAPPEKRYVLEDASAALLVAEADQGTDGGRDGGAGPGRAAPLAAMPLGTVSVGGEADGWRELTSCSRAYPRPRPAPDEPAGIAYTSGTTGRPKGVVHSQHNLLLPGAVLVAVRGFGPGLRKGDCTALTILNMQVTSTLLVAQAGGTQVLMDRVDPAGVAAWIRDEAVTAWFGVPTLLHGLANSPEVDEADLRSLAEVWTGGSSLPASVRAAFEHRFGVPVFATYGLTEAPAVVTIEPRGSGRAESSGRPLPHLSVEVRDAAGRVLPAGVAGEITVGAVSSGPWAGLYRPMLGYLHLPEATNATVHGARLHTGDVGLLDREGRLHVHDRQNALILRGGANVYPAEVERVLLKVPGVRGASVVGVADDRLGQRVAAAIELDDGVRLDQEELRARCQEELARYKVPEEWRFAPLPRNAMGKVRRRDVEAWFSDERGR